MTTRGRTDRGGTGLEGTAPGGTAPEGTDPEETAREAEVGKATEAAGATQADGSADLPRGRRTALVHDWLTGMRGGEKVLEEIATLFPGSPIHTLFHFPNSVSPALESHPVHTSYLQDWPGVRRHYRRYLPFFPAAIEDFDLGGAELVVSSSHCVAKGIVPPPGAFHLCYCHSPMRYAWDQEHAYFPNRRGLVARLRGTALSRLRAWDVAASARVDLFLANSRFVAQRIRRYYRREAEVLHPPVDVERFTPGEPGGSAAGSTSGFGEAGYCLTVAALAPYKRVEVAIAACERLGMEIRVVGGGPEQERLRRVAGPRTRLLGRVADAELPELYRGASFLLQPGTEDFGIAPVEALACATPVVALAEGGVLDIVDDGVHGVLYEVAEATAESRIAALAAAIDKARQIRFNDLNLRSRAELFSRSRFRERFLEFLRSGLARHGNPAERRTPDRSTARGTPAP